MANFGRSLQFCDDVVKANREERWCHWISLLYAGGAGNYLRAVVNPAATVKAPACPTHQVWAMLLHSLQAGVAVDGVISIGYVHFQQQLVWVHFSYPGLDTQYRGLDHWSFGPCTSFKASFETRLRKNSPTTTGRRPWSFLLSGIRRPPQKNSCSSWGR